ncbi:MAG: acyltransferase [Bacteroidia bacterium]
MSKIKKVLRFICGLIPYLNVVLLKIIGEKVSLKANLGVLFLWCDKIELQDGVYIGGFNIIFVRSFYCGKGVKIRGLNIFKGNFDCVFDDSVGISRFNKFTSPYSDYKSTLRLKRNARITQKSIIDLTDDVEIGENSQLAGLGTQIWTHGYFHIENNRRFRVDGSVVIGDDCYLGSHSIVSPGTKILRGCNFASLSNITGFYEKPGLYGSSKAVYKKALEINEFDKKLKKRTNGSEIIYKKN